MKRLLAGIALASLSLTVLMLLHRIGVLHDQIARTPRERPVERTVVVEKIVHPPAPELPAPEPPKVVASAAPSPIAPPAAPDDAGVIRITRQIVFPDSVEDLELSDYQRSRIEDHKRVRDAAHAIADELYDAALRTELSAEQYEKFKNRPRIGFMISGDALYRSGAQLEFNP